MIDNEFTKAVQDWLAAEPKTEAMAAEGAHLLLRISPRNSAYRRYLSLAASRPAHILGKIEYELKMHLRYRLDGLTLEQVRRLDQKVVPEARTLLDKGEPETADTAEASETAEGNTLGRRADHDQLPDEIKRLWTDNAALYKDIKALFEELKSMEDLPSCQRYDKLQLLAAKDKRYLSNMEHYDAYVLEAAEAEATENDQKTTDNAQETTDYKAVANARAYLSKNLEKLGALFKKAAGKDAESTERKTYAALLEKMQQRADILVANGVMTDEMRANLEVLGLTIKPGNHGATDTTDAASAS